MKKNYIKIVLDLMMAITFVMLMNPRVLGGLPFHEVAGLVIGVMVLTHIGLNYRWVINTMKKIFDSKLPKKTRFSLLLNILMLVTMSGIIVTGILISKVVFPNLAVGSHSIRGTHSLFANTTLALVGLHIGVHWQWIMSIYKKAFKTKEGKYRTGVIASVVLSLAILAGGMQWYASASTKSNTASTTANQQTVQMSNTSSTFNTSNTSNTSSSTNTFQGPPTGDFHGGKDGHGGSSSPWVDALEYFAIWGAIIIPTFYIEKRLLRNKRQSKKTQPQLTT
jgi:hypothetical protein